MRMNERMSRLLAEAQLDAKEDVEEGDAPDPFLAIVAEGWMVDANGAQLLKALHPGYASTGRPEGLEDVIHYEASVNGRGMMDYDLPPSGPDRQKLLMRRCLGYSYAALRAVPSSYEWPVFGYVSLSDGGLHDDTLTANVTFCSQRTDVIPYVADVNSYADEALLEISQTDVLGPLLP